MTGDSPRKLIVTLGGGEPLSGSVQADDQRPVAFAGWLEFLALLDSFCRPSASDGASAIAAQPDG